MPQITESKPSVWVVIPTYNEKSNISRLIAVLFALHVPALSVLVVDDSSPDGTGDMVKNLSSRYPRLHLLSRPKKAGLGRAYAAGFAQALASGATAVVQMDADFSHDPADIPRLLAALAEHDVAIGSRFSNGISVVNWPLRRLLLSIAANMYASAVTGLRLKDVTGGFKAWRAPALAATNLSTIGADGYGFQIATTYRAWKAGYRVIEVPIVFTERRAGQSKMSKTIVWEAIWLVWKLRLRP